MKLCLFEFAPRVDIRYDMSIIPIIIYLSYIYFFSDKLYTGPSLYTVTRKTYRLWNSQKSNG